MDKNEIIKRAAEEQTAWINSAYNAGYNNGREDTEKIFQEKDQTTTLDEPSEKDKEKYKWFQLTAFCHECQKGLGAHAHTYTFCPHCGRKIIEKEKT